MNMKHLRRIGLVLIFVLAFSTALSAQDPSVLLEKAIYTEETLGNLNEAIGIYQQVAANTETGRDTAALALYRLGMCYQKSGRTSDAQAAFAKLSKLYPERQDLISKIPGTSAAPMEFRQAPWVDGEVLSLAIKVRGGGQTGMRFYSMESTQESGKTLWKLKSVEGNISANQYITLLMNNQTYAPISSIQKIPTYGEFQALYAPQQVEFVTTRSGSVNKKQVSLNRAAYDDVQLGYLLRCLPLQEGFQIPIAIANTEKASVWDAKIAVVAREKVTVDAGTFDCFKTTITLANQEQTAWRTYWISADSHFYIVKEQQSGVTYELVSINVVKKNQPVRYEDSKSGISLEAPCGWFIGNTTNQQGLERVITFIGPEAESDGYLIFVDLKQDGSPATPLEVDVSKHIASEQRSYQEYTVRPESRGPTTVSGFTAIRFIADFKALMTQQDSVRYMLFFTSPAREFRLRFETGKDNFDRLRPTFDSIISSLRVQ
jgi:tetratricopeptide (TPR) repeat protein